MNARQRRKARRQREREAAAAWAWAADVVRRCRAEGRPILSIQGTLSDGEIAEFRRQWRAMVAGAGSRPLHIITVDQHGKNRAKDRS